MPAVTDSTAKRRRLFERYRTRIRTNPALARTIVSDQANRKARFFRWFKYKEAFSAALAEEVIGRYTRAGDVVLDPFAGVGTALLVARAMGRRPMGIELLPVGVFAIEARRSAETVSPRVFARRVEAVAGVDWSSRPGEGYGLRHVPITRGAFPPGTERGLAGYRAYCERRLRHPDVRRLFQLAGLGVLESVSYTRKDGQYLRWDCRAQRPGVRSRFNKRRIEEFNAAIHRQLRCMSDDLGRGPHARPDHGPLDLRAGSCLDLLPETPDESVDLVLTSPPYCNRYDYTRTYALELVYLGVDEAAIKRLRQSMLSCTVENGEKVGTIETAYRARGRGGDFDRVLRVYRGQSALHEVLDILEQSGRRGELNNANIPRMVRNYFLEMSFVVYELARLLRPGGRAVMVNDNVRYAGEEVPVDLILSDTAARFGLRVEHVWTLDRGKGNSSQQMGVHGRRELRKCVYVWKKSGVRA